MMTPSPIEHSTSRSQDASATRVGDHDVPYVFGRLPHAAAPFPFSTREFARLLVLRSRIRAGEACADDGAAS